MNPGPGDGDPKDAGLPVRALASRLTSAQAAGYGTGERLTMSIIHAAKKLLGFGSDGDHTDKDFVKGEFSESAMQARNAFVQHKKDHPKLKSVDEMTPIERRMQSGSI